MANNLARKLPLVFGGAAVYTGACIIAYQAIQTNRRDIQDTEERLAEHANYSFVRDPRRTQTFESVAESYDQQIGRDESVMGINLLRRSLLYFHAKGTVLEVGAGTGRNIGYYPRSGVDRVLLTDTSEKMLKQAKEKLKGLDESSKPQFACLEGDSMKLNFPEQYFDTVVDTFGLCSYDDPVAVLKELSRVCKPGGKILLLEHGRSKTWDFISKYLDNNAERHAKNWGCVWNRDLDQILAESGLALDTLTTWHFGTTYYVVCRPSSQQTSVGAPDKTNNIVASSMRDKHCACIR